MNSMTIFGLLPSKYHRLCICILAFSISYMTFLDHKKNIEFRVFNSTLNCV